MTHFHSRLMHAARSPGRQLRAGSEGEKCSESTRAGLQRGRRDVSRGIRKGWSSKRAQPGSPGCCAGVWSLLQPPQKDPGGTRELQPAHKKSLCLSARYGLLFLKLPRDNENRLAPSQLLSPLLGWLLTFLLIKAARDLCKGCPFCACAIHWNFSLPFSRSLGST